MHRRDFLKLAGAGLAALALTPLPPEDQPPPPWGYGRVAATWIGLYDAPSFDSRRIKYLPLDTVLALWEATVGDSRPAHNRVWYVVTGGYIHSSWVQTVERVRNQPVAPLPEDGLLAEVSVPFTDARHAPLPGAGVAYRLYYGTTHWLHGAYADGEGRLWYRLYDDGQMAYYFAPARDFRPVTADDLAPLSPQVADKRIVVDLTAQSLTAYEDRAAVFMTRVATGIITPSAEFITPAGDYRIGRKRPSRHMSGGDRASADYFDLPGVPWVSYFTDTGISLHGTYWHNDFGRPRSHGCVNLTPQAARWVYRWTLPVVPVGEGYRAEAGTRVIVY